MFKFLMYFTLCLSFSWAQDTSDVIVWNEHRPLTWNDFRGQPQKRFACASTVYKIDKNVSSGGPGKATVKIEALFFCNDSWKKEEWISASILAHEQKHFDIVELYARKLRKQIASGTYSSLKDVENKLDAYFKKIDKEMDVYQDDYDDKTDGSMNGDKQRIWNKRIQEELQALSAYSSVEVRITL